MNPEFIKIELRFADVKRLRIATISNRTVLVLAAPRTDLEFLLERRELVQPGVYLLLGGVSGRKKPQAYVGEAENVRERLKQHSTKDFWLVAYILTDKDQSLTKAHIKYLEGQLIVAAKTAARYDIQNSQSSGAKLPDSERESTENYLQWARQLLDALGCDLFDSENTQTSMFARVAQSAQPNTPVR